jgi:hypothetical protein
MLCREEMLHMLMDEDAGAQNVFILTLLLSNIAFTI